MFGFKFKETSQKEHPEIMKSKENPVLSEIHDFNMGDKITSAGELAQYNIDLIDNFFQSNEDTSQELLAAEEKSISPEKNIVILKKLDAHSGTFMEPDIYDYYRETYLQSINNSLQKRAIPKAKIELFVDQILTNLAKKPITRFKEDLKTTLSTGGVPEEDFATFWQWRITNPPSSEPLLIHKNDEDYIQYDNFASITAIKDFISQKNKSVTEEENMGGMLLNTQDLQSLEDELGNFADQLNK